MLIFNKRRKTSFLLFMIPYLCFYGCVSVPSPPPPSGVCTFTIPQPNNYNCYAKHQGPGVPTTKIKLMINVTTKYVNPANAGGDFIV